jgi:hypothetical protein
VYKVLCDIEDLAGYTPHSVGEGNEWTSVAEVIKNHENAKVRNIGQGEARHRKYKRLKFGGGQAYERSSD